MSIKPSAFSHSWYPGDPAGCRKTIEQFCRENQERPANVPGSCLGGIVPHAGWVFSGRIACRVIQALASTRGPGNIDTIVLFGGHMRETDPVFLLASGAVDTPLGPVEADREMAEALADLTGANALQPRDFPDENTLELQYPFIRFFFPDAKLLAVGVPPSARAGEAGRGVVEAALALGRKIRVIGSTDMTHYGVNFGFAPHGTGRAAVDWVINENDAGAVEKLLDMDGKGIIREGLSRRNMCCPGAAAAAATACKKQGAAKGVCLDRATSYDTSKSDSFVGYCGVVFSKRQGSQCNPQQL